MPQILNALYVQVRKRSIPRSCYQIIFSDLFESPIRVTQCGHVLCEKCLLGTSDGKQSWLCPECREFHNCAINTLARNYHLEKLVEKFKKINGIKMEEPPQGKNQSSWCNRLSSLVHHNLKKKLLETLAILSQSQNPLSRKSVKTSVVKTILLGWTILPWESMK